MAATHQGSKFSICTTPQDSELNQAAFELLTFIEVGGVGNFGETGTNTNIVSYPTMSDEFIQKMKGQKDAGDPPLEVSRDYNDAGQIAMRAAGATNYNYAFKFELNDGPSGMTNTIYFNRGLVSEPTRPNGGSEDVVIETYTLGLNQGEVVVDPV